MAKKTIEEMHGRFLTHGFFAPELPPCFNSFDLGASRAVLKAAFDKVKGTKEKPLNKFNYVSRPCKFRFPRYKNSDRLHTVINPVSYFFLSEVLADSYSELRTISKTSKITGTPNTFDWKGRRALRRPNFEVKDEFTSLVAANFNFTLKTDISAFYHNVYTHSIPWAVHGKSLSKSKKKDLTLKGNLIDLLVRNAQDSQTVGLPVGPDTSRMIAEVIAAAVDGIVQPEFTSKQIDAKRFVDDFTVGCQTRADAEHALAKIRLAANQFELELNAAKTLILENVNREETGWKDLIKSKVPKQTGKPRDFNIFFFEASELQKSLPEHNVLKFGLRNARKSFVNCESWDVIESYLMSAYRTNATLVDTFVELLIERQKAKGDVNKEKIGKFVSARIPSLINQNRSGEIIWLIYLARCLAITVKSECFEGLFGESEPLLALQIADLDHSGLIDGPINYSTWDSNFSTASLDEAMWLYSYQAVVSGFRTPITGDAHIKEHTFFSLLLQNKVSFYKPDENQPALATSMKTLKTDNDANKATLEKFIAHEDIDPDDLDDFDEIDEEDSVSLYE